MAEFVARLGTGGGEILERTFVSENEEALRRDLNQKGYYVFSIQSKRRWLDVLQPFRRGHRVSHREFAVFNHEFATLLKAGLPVLQGLDLLLERMESPVFRNVLREIRDQVKGGSALSDAFGACPQYFPALYAASLRAGERSGELEGVIRRYLVYTRVIEEVRRQVSQAVVYPVILLCFSGGVVWVLLTYAIPRFAEFYEHFGKELPWITRTLIDVSTFLNRHWPWVLAGMGAALAGASLWWQGEAGRHARDRWKLRVPFLGRIWQKFAVSQLTRALATLLRGGIPLVSALGVAADSVGNRVVGSRARAVVQNVREGESLSSALEKTGVLPPMVIEMVKVGESTGALSEMLENVAGYYDEDIAHDLQRFLTVLEPLLLIFMGGVVATMLISMYLPLFQLQTIAH
jgi:type IV pilus assembly protein PilC